MDGSVIAESARWGDFRVDVDPGRWASANFALYTKNDHYLPDQLYILRAYIPRRGLVLLNQLRSRGLYPATEAPVFAQHGGNVPLNFALTGFALTSHTRRISLAGCSGIAVRAY